MRIGTPAPATIASIVGGASGSSANAEPVRVPGACASITASTSLRTASVPSSSTDGSGVGLVLQSVGRRDICSVGVRSGPRPGGAQDEGQDQHFDSDGEAVEEGPVQ